MPTVPRGQRTAGITGLQGGRRSASETELSTGVGVSRATADKDLALSRFGQEVTAAGVSMFGEIVDAERAKANQTALLEASNKLSNWRNARLYDANKGAFTLKGKDAQQLPEDIADEFEQVAGEIAGGLHTPEQQIAFARLRSQEWQSLDLEVRRHTMKEMEAYTAGELRAHVGNSVNAAIQSFEDPKLVAVNLDKAVAGLKASGKAAGMGQEAIDASIAAAQSTTHLGVISQLLAADKTQQASDYFAAVKGQIDGDKQDGVVKALEEGTLRGQGQKLADKIIAEGGPLSAQRAKAKEIADPKLRDQVEQRIEHNDAVSEKEKQEAEKALYRGAYDILDRTPDVRKIPPDVWTQLDGNERNALLSYAHRKLKGEPIETDQVAFYTLIQNARDVPADFAKENLLKYRHKLSDGDFQQLASLQLSIASGNAAAAAKTLAPYDVDDKLLTDSLRLYGLDPKDDAQAPKIARMRQILRDGGDALQKATGKVPQNADLQKIIDETLMLEMSVPGGWFGGKTQKQIIDATIDDVPVTFKRRYPGLSGEAMVTKWIEAQVGTFNGRLAPNTPPMKGGR